MATPTVIPENLRTPRFLHLWDDWVRHRSEIRKPLKPTTIAYQLKRLAAWGEAAACAAIEESIAQGWQGLFPPKGSNHGTGGARGTGQTYEPGTDYDHLWGVRGAGDGEGPAAD